MSKGRRVKKPVSLCAGHRLNVLVLGTILNTINGLLLGAAWTNALKDEGKHPNGIKPFPPKASSKLVLTRQSGHTTARYTRKPHSSRYARVARVIATSNHDGTPTDFSSWTVEIRTK